MESTWELRDHTKCRLLNFYSSHSLTAVTYATEVAIPSISFPLDEKSLTPTTTKRTHRQEPNTYSITNPQPWQEKKKQEAHLPSRKIPSPYKSSSNKAQTPSTPPNSSPAPLTDAKLRTRLIGIYPRQILERPKHLFTRSNHNMNFPTFTGV